MYLCAFTDDLNECERVCVCLCVWVYLRVWPQVDVVFGHKAFSIVKLSCVPVRVILHVDDLRAHTHTQLEMTYYP